ncbi:MAG: acyl-CoA dehydratase activase [Geothrix sp.]|nr:acyl-CoA dehydratase activase [Geothrix sp.]
MALGKAILALDIGSVSTSLVVLDRDRQVLHRGHGPHHGHIAQSVVDLLADVDLSEIGWVATTGSTPARIRSSGRFDDRLAVMAAAQHLHPDLGAVLYIGGEHFGLITFDENHEYRDAHGNSSCAAGTGSFLDEQAENLGLHGSAALGAAAERSDRPPPRIASRCAVFAKTDVTHAQQQGYSRESICDGLCQGLAATVVDALFSGGAVPTPIVLAGGVAQNAAVVRHLTALIGSDLVVDPWAHVYGAQGAALLLLAQITGAGGEAPPSPEPLDLHRPGDLLLEEHGGRTYAHGPIDRDLPDYPDFRGIERYLFEPRVVREAEPVEVDIYRAVPPGTRSRLFLGLDIGSTSTKAVLLDEAREVVAGFYTRTTGRPLLATQALFEAIQSWGDGRTLELAFAGVGTTGAGRKFMAAIIGADLVIDEISAHARAAFDLDPEVDTILEIGGQDAKFTTLKNGMVTSAVMNTVCAAGTGTFIEEQARRLHTPLAEISAKVGSVRSPRSSDRCTVFMQRDINHLIASGYSVPETLAAVLHSVRENYLRKVAQEGSIGQHICFQGATAKNRALVAAFAQNLDKPIRVSRYCHLTGALGVALMLAEEALEASKFKGLGLFRAQIPITQETCDLCANACRILVADVAGDKAAYGFLCGRDYGVDHYVSKNTSGFDLLKARRKVPRPPDLAAERGHLTMGILSGLQFFEEADLWQTFFAELGVRTLTVPGRKEHIAAGKKVERAEFCAPMAILHAQAEELGRRADHLFVPLNLESTERQGDLRRQYCYYSQYAVTLIADLENGGLRKKCVTPVIARGLTTLQTRLNLLSALKPVLGEDLGFSEVSSAYAKALEVHAAWREGLKKVFAQETANVEDPIVVLIGRPYVALSPAMNKGIPDIFAALGVKTFFQDMLTYDEQDVEPIADLLKALHWHYAAKALEATQVVAGTPGLYPVFVTSFKCAPDSCILDYFKRICEGHHKPYLVLQLDDHDSAVGYETRIEAAVRAFRNHRWAAGPTPEAAPPRRPVVSPLARDLEGKVLLFPCWDRLTCKLLVANLANAGIDARLISEDADTVARSLARNAGQCIPLNIIAQTFVDHVRRWDLDPARTLLWMSKSTVACHIGMYPQAIQSLVAGYGGGFEQARVYAGDITMIDISLRAALNSYFCHMFGGLLRRLGCRIRPYETVPGLTDRVAEEGLILFEYAFLHDLPKLDVVRRVVDRFAEIPKQVRPRPKVAIFGDLYARDNETLNQDLVRTIEAHGGEVITTPFNEYIKTTAGLYLRKWIREGKYLRVLASGSLLTTVQLMEKKYTEEFGRLLGPTPEEGPGLEPEEILGKFNVSSHHTGETMDNLLNVFHVLEAHPDLALFVHASPAFCCPGLVTEALGPQIERATGVPMVSVTYDGTDASKNDAVIPYLKFPRHRATPLLQEELAAPAGADPG